LIVESQYFGLLSVAEGFALCRFVRNWFQFLFHWASRPSFHLSLTVLVHYRLQVVFSLGGWFPQLPTVYLHRGTQEIPRESVKFRIQGFHFLWPDIPDCSATWQILMLGSYNPHSCAAREAPNHKITRLHQLCWKHCGQANSKQDLNSKKIF